MSHALIALAKLGGDIPRLERFVHWYSKRLGLGYLEDSPQKRRRSSSVNTLQLEQLKGARTNFNSIRNFYTDLLVNKYNWDFTVAAKEELPVLVMGLCSAAFHALIQLGYGLSEAHPLIVSEGFAYIHYAYRPLVTNSGSLRLTLTRDTQRIDFAAVRNILEATLSDPILRRFATDREFRAAIKAKYPGIGAFQPLVIELFAGHGDILYEYAKRILIPVHSSDTQQSLEEVCDFFLAITINLLALCYRKNDFFLLHAVTGAWALREVLRCVVTFDLPCDLAHTDTHTELPQLIHDAGVVFLCGLVATYISQGAPTFLDEACTISDSAHDWGSLISSLLEKDEEEHVFKLVAVCFELYSALQEAVNLSPPVKEARIKMLWQCAQNAVSAPLYFHSDRKDLQIIAASSNTASTVV